MESCDISILIAQFFNKTTNRRTDEYGGSIENRARLFFEILETVLRHVPSARVGVKTGPMNVDGAFLANDETLPTSEYVISRLNDYNLSHLLLMGATTDFSGTPLAALVGDGMFRHFRALYRGPLIANTEIDRERGNRLIEGGLADMVAFGRPYIANPDLPERFATGALLAELDWKTVYASGPAGYTDYPALEPVAG